MKAKKENKVYQLNTDAEKERYLNQGFDIYDDDGEIIEHSPLKKVSYSELEAVKKELQKLKESKAENAADDSEVLKIVTAYAAEHQIELGKATTIKGIIKKIQEVSEKGEQ